MTPVARTPRPAARRPLPDTHVLYEASVQGVEYDLDFFERVHRRHHGRTFRDFREDFCGTAAMAGAWVLRRPGNRAWGVDLDAPTLEWARAHRVARMRGAARRLTLLQSDVRDVTRPPVDVACAMNYSYWVFKRRADLVRYFRAVHRSLRRRGLFFASVYGGTEAMGRLEERRRISPTTSVDGDPVPGFVYVWEQEGFNPVTNELRCHIHFRLAGGREVRRAFTYDWRMWSLPEVEEAMREAGFGAVEHYIDAWNEKTNSSDDVLRLKRRFENQEGWLAVVVGIA